MVFSKVMLAFVMRARRALEPVFHSVAGLWRRFRALPGLWQGVIGVVVVVLVIAGFSFLRGLGATQTTQTVRAVSLASVGELAGTGSGASLLGTVRAREEAEILSESGGTVRRVNTSLGANVGAGAVIAELDNESERAAVLQAEGAYDAAIAARQSVSPENIDTVARNEYREAFTALDTTLENDIDDFFGGPSPVGPDLLINPGPGDESALSRTRAEIENLMNSWFRELGGADSSDPETLLVDAVANARAIEQFVTDLANAANRTNSNATSEQIASLASARASVSAVLASLTSAQTSYRSGASATTASVDASVKSALGTLRFAQANLEKTIIRAPISGTIAFLPLRTGSYVTALSHVATVSQEGGFEVIAYVSEEDRDQVAAGTKVLVEETDGIVTKVSPALDPVTRQIEVRIAIESEDTRLVSGQSVRVTLPGVAVAEAIEGPLFLPLSSVKLRPDDRVVFTVNAEGRLSAVKVETGDVRGGTIEILTPLSAEMRIVSDARGLAEGEKVTVAP